MKEIEVKITAEEANMVFTCASYFADAAKAIPSETEEQVRAIAKKFYEVYAQMCD